MIGHENTLDRFSKVEIKCISTALSQIPVTSMPTLQKYLLPDVRDTNQYITEQYIDIANININIGF